MESSTRSAAQSLHFIKTRAKNSSSGESVEKDPPSVSEQPPEQPSGEPVLLSLRHRSSSSTSIGMDTVSIRAQLEKLDSQGKLENSDLQRTERVSSGPVKTSVALPLASRQSKGMNGFFSSIASALGRFASRVRNGIARLFLRNQVRTLENQSTRAEQRLQKLEKAVSTAKPAAPISKLSLKADVDGFRMMLENPDLRVKFEKQLQKEFSSENLAFIMACEAFGKLDASDKCERALEIMHEFIGHEAPQQVNLSDGQHRALVEAREAHKKGQTELNGVPIAEAMNTAMKAAQAGITGLMVSDTFARFLAKTYGK
jgi:hypothetical protein